MMASFLSPAWLAVVCAALAAGSGTAQGATTPGCTCASPRVATYRMTFTSTWTDPPRPPGAHWSSPVGTSHSPCYTMWMAGTDASAGIERMAESGSTFTLASEFAAQGANTLSTFRPGGFGALGSESATFTADRYRPLVSVTSMIAPSPDWFVGVNSANLCSNDTWVSRLEHAAFPYDAGTDNGLAFDTFPDIDKNPRETIARITATSPKTTSFRKGSGSTVAMGIFVFELLNTALPNAASGPSVPVNPGCATCSNPAGGGELTTPSSSAASVAQNMATTAGAEGVLPPSLALVSFLLAGAQLF